MKKLKSIVSNNLVPSIFIIFSIILFTSVIILGRNNKVSNIDSASTKVVATEVDKARLEVLKKNFDYKYDEFEKNGWYTDKNQEDIYDKTYLGVNVDSSGNAYLVSYHLGKDWIFHTKVQVKIGDAIYETYDVPTYDKNNIEQSHGGYVQEVILYTNGDNGIIKAIAESGDTPIKVRFSGSENIQDIILSKTDQQAIKDSYELSQLLKKIND